MLVIFGKRRQKDIAGPSIEIERHACPGDKSVRMLRKLKAFISETGHEPEPFPDEHIQRHHKLGMPKSAS